MLQAVTSTSSRRAHDPADDGLGQESHGKLPAVGYFLGLFLFVVVAGWLDTKIPWPRTRGR
jgi:hypothetical protein